MRYGFIGAGNMCSAIIKGMAAAEIYVYDICREKCEALGSKVNVCADNNEVIANADMLILGVKPNMLQGFFDAHKDALQEHKPLLVSLAAGKTISFLEECIGVDMPVVRVMPNINSVCLSSTTGYCCNKLVNTEHKNQIEELFGNIGTVMEIADESKFPVFTALAGSSPAFCYMYIDALARAGQKAGMSRDQALQIAAETVLGSAKMILASEEHPFALIDRVCSPGGTTIEGVSVLQKESFESIINSAIEAVIEKDKKLAQK